MTQTWSSDDAGDDARPIGVARAIPVAADGGAADAWQRAARIVAWVMAVMGGNGLVAIVLDQVGTRSSSGFGDLTEIFRAAAWPGAMLSILGLAHLALGAMALVGSIGVLSRRRWGSLVLMAYAVGTVPAMALYMIWFIVSNRNSSFVGAGGFPLFLVTFTLSNLAQLALPAVVFFVMRAARPHLGKLAGGSAFEPLPRQT